MAKLLKVFQQTSWQVLAKIVTSVSTFIILGLVARNYGEEGTGLFTLALTYLAIFYLLADFGFNAHVLSRLQAAGISLQDEWRKLFGARMLWSVILMILALGTLSWWPFASLEFSKAIQFGFLAILASSIFVTCNLIFQSKLRYDLSALASIIGTLLGLLVFWYVVNSKLDVPYLILGHLTSWILISILAWIFIRKFIKVTTPLYEKSYITSLFKDSWPIAATLALNVVYFRIDSFILSYFHGISAVGVYNLAYSVFQSALVLPTFIMNAFYPMMLESLKVKSESFFKNINLSAAGLLVTSLLVLAVTFLLSPVIIKVISGGGFEGSTTTLRILALSFPAYFLSSLLMWVMVAKGKYKTMVVIYGAGLLFNVVANLIYIPSNSYIAAAWITGISEYLILFAQIIAVYRLSRA